MRVRIFPGGAAGSVCVPPSKSIAHRMLICAGLADGVSRIRHTGDCEDVRATLDCLRLLGADCLSEGDAVTVRGGLSKEPPQMPLPCRESGSTLRFFIPIALTAAFPVTFTGSARLLERPQTVYEELCRERGLSFSRHGQTLTVQGPLPSGDFPIAGNISSQFVTGLLFALSLLPNGSRILLLPPVESRPYIDLTLDVLRRFGVCAEWETDRILRIPGGQHYVSADCEVEGDWSGGAFWAALDCLGENSVRVPNLRSDSLQGDRACVPLLERLRTGNSCISLSDCPDLGPVLFAYAGSMHGGTFTGTDRLRVKESDRVEAMRQELEKCGISMEVGENRVTVRAGELHTPTVPLDGHNDHRIVMALAVLLTRIGGEISGAEAVRKSYPGFFGDLAALGIRTEITKD